MLTPICTATYDRPDVCCLWAAAMRATLRTPHALVVFHAHDKPPCGDAHATWDAVGIHRTARPPFHAVFNALPKGGPRAYIEEDIIPVRPWSLDDYAGNPAILRHEKGQLWWAFTIYRDGGPRPLMYSNPTIVPQRPVRDGGCPDWVPEPLREPAMAADAKVVGEHFLHIDKLGNWHQRSPEKEALVQALTDWVRDLEPVTPQAEPTLLGKAVHFATSAAVMPQASALRPAAKQRTLEEQDPTGPGTFLSKMLEKIGINSSPTCSCKARAYKMNEMGADWCEQNLDMIVGWLREEATKRKLPFVDFAGKLLVKRAIKLSRGALVKAEQQCDAPDTPPLNPDSQAGAG